MISVKSEMVSPLISISTTDTLDVAYAKMAKFEIRHLPVVNEDGVLTGMISDRDLQRALKSEVKSENGMRTEFCDFDPQARVSDYMNWPVRTIDKDVSLKTVVNRMIAEKISSFLVTDKSEVIGIVTTEDLLKVLARLIDEPERGIRDMVSDYMFQTPRLHRAVNFG